jgi:hypothetical protein
MEEEKLSVDDMGIFQNQEAVVENIKESAKSVGVNTPGIDKIKDGKPLEFLVAKKGCKQCWGRGKVTFIPNDSKKVRNTSLSEDRAERRSRLTTALCKCVKIHME